MGPHFFCWGTRTRPPNHACTYYMLLRKSRAFLDSACLGRTFRDNIQVEWVYISWNARMIESMKTEMPKARRPFAFWYYAVQEPGLLSDVSPNIRSIKNAISFRAIAVFSDSGSLFWISLNATWRHLRGGVSSSRRIGYNSLVSV